MIASSYSHLVRVTAFLWLVAGLVFAEEPLAIEKLSFSEDYYLRVWGRANGWTDNPVNGIGQTSDGYLWLGTRTGLIRFDGVHFTSIHAGPETGLAASEISSIYVSRRGVLWVGFRQGGIARQIGNHFETIAPVEAGVQWTGSFAEDNEGGIWFGYGPGPCILRWKNGELSRFGPAQGVGPGEFPNLCTGADGRVWYWSRGGCGWFDGERFQPITLPLESPFTMMTPSGEGSLWVVSGEKLLRGKAKGSWEVAADLSWPGGPRRIMAMYEDRAGSLWIGTRANGLLCYHEGKLERVPTSSSQILTIAEDQAGNIWIGMGAGNFNRLSRREFTFRKAPQDSDAITQDFVQSLSLDPNGTMWLVQSNTPVRADDQANQTFKRAADFLHPSNIMTLAPMDGEGVWLGSLDGVLRLQNRKLSKEAIETQITGLLKDRQGNLWVAPINGPLIRLQKGVAHPYPTNLGLVNPRAMAEDSDGQIWVGTESGRVFRSTKDGFAPMPLPDAGPGQPVRFIIPDGKETVWIGACKAGLYRWRAGTLLHMPSWPGFATADVRSLLIEPSIDGAKDAFWITTSAGLFRGFREELEAVIEGRRRSSGLRSFGSDDDFPSLDFPYGFLHTTARTPDGNLWFASSAGALVITPSRLHSAPSYPLAIEELEVDSQSVPFAPPAEIMLPPQPGSVQIRFTLPQMNGADELQFRYRLVGLNNDWENTDGRRQASFTRLPPGNYRFEVMAGTRDGYWLPQSAALGFIVQAAWWETIAFQMAASVLGALAFGWLVRHSVLVRERLRTRTLDRERALERERIRIARDMHDELGASLTQISYASQLAKLDPEAAAFQINEIAAIAQRTVSSLDEIVWAVNPRNDTLSALLEYLALYAVSFLSTVGITCNVDLPEELPKKSLSADVRHHLFLVAKEALNNVAKHSGAGFASLKIEATSSALRIVIEDEGLGTTKTSTGNGLSNMRDRMNEVGGTFQMQIRPEGGTRVTIELPFNKLHH